MALESGNGTDMVMPVAPTGGGFGGNAGFGYGDNGIWWILLLFIILGGWGNGYGGYGNGGGTNQIDNTISRGFDQSAVMSGLAGINTALSNAEVSRCNLQSSLSNQINTVGMSAMANQAATQAGIADLKYTVGSEACADRAQVSQNTTDILAAIQASNQRILDQMCADKIDAKNEEINRLRQQLDMVSLADSQNAQTNTIISALRTQPPVAAYVVPNPYQTCGCNNNSYGCGCGV